MTALPPGWAEAPLGDLGDSIRGSVQPNQSEIFELYSVPSFSDGRPEILQGSEIGSHKRPVLPLDLLVCKINPRINRVWIVGPRTDHEQLASPEWLVLRSSAPEISTMLRYQLSAPDFRRWIEAGVHGVTGSHTRAKDDHVLAFPVRVPPEFEQARVVTAIEEASSKLDAGERGLRTVRQLIKRMRDAVLAAAVTGRLVSQDSADAPADELLADLGIGCLASGAEPPGWACVRIGDIARVGSGTTPERGRQEYWSDGSIPWVTSGALSAGVVTYAAEFVTEMALRETSLRLWPPGTLLVAMYGEGQTRGRCAELAIEATCNQACAAIDLHTGLRGYRRLLRLHFDANYSANRRLASGGVQPNLSGTLIKGMTIALPPMAEAHRIVTEVDRQLSFLDACDRAVDAGLARSAALRRSVLKSAFEGKLAPQDSTDEPASALLERIRDGRRATKPRTARATA